jgi:hypothetical protein
MPGADRTEDRSLWPPLPLREWEETYATLHMWSQVVGKVRLALAPQQNHSWHVPLYLTARGLTTSPIPAAGRTFEIELDFVSHELQVSVSDGARRAFPLEPMSVAEFHRRLMNALAELEIEVEIWTRPQEVEVAIPFEEDLTHASYDPDAAHRHWQILAQIERVLQSFREGFVGKTSPTHFFWGSFDLAHTRFSGRRAPCHPGGVPNLADHVVQEAYSHELHSLGFWPGGGPVEGPAFYAYAYPEPPGFSAAPIEPEGSYYFEPLKEFILPYDVVRSAADPDAALLAFARSTYAAAASLGGWPRGELETDPLD